MASRRFFNWAWLTSLAALVSSCKSMHTEMATGPSVTIDEIAAGIQKHIAEQSTASGGYFKVQFNKKELNLELVRVHLEYLSELGRGVHFACVDLVGTDGSVYDVDFFMKGPPGAMTVTETSVHKINGQPRYAWEQRRNGTWRKVPAEKASPRLLGALRGSDELESIYRTKLPAITGNARLWLPLATSDTFQRVTVGGIHAPEQWREFEVREQGHRVLFLHASRAAGGKSIDIGYHGKRIET